MAPAIRPTQLSAPASGGAPEFVVTPDGAQAFDVELTIDPILLNGTNQNRRRDANYFRAPRQPGAPAASIAFSMPNAVWLRLRQAPLLYYRATTYDWRGQRAWTSLDDLDYERAPFVILLVGVPRLMPLAEITPTADGVAAHGNPPSFNVRAGTQLLYSVEVASDPSLFAPDQVYRRAQANFYSSYLGTPVAAGQELMTQRGGALYTLPQPAWQELARAPRLHYRTITARTIYGLDTRASVELRALASAPFVTVRPDAAASAAEVDHRQSGLCMADRSVLDDNPPPALVIRGDGRTNCVVEVATGLNLLQPGAPALPANAYFNSGLGGSPGGAAVPAVALSLASGAASYVLPRAVWSALGAARFLFYRVTTFNLDAAGARTDQAQSVANAAHRMPGRWGGLPIDSELHGGFQFLSDGRVISGQLSSDHGPRSVAAGRTWHPGIDLVPFDGIPIYAVDDGRIDHLNNDIGHVRIDHGLFKSSYLHMMTPLGGQPAIPGILVGALVRRGEQIGVSHNTGTPAFHLHFELEGAGKNSLARVRHTERGALRGPDYLTSIPADALPSRPEWTVELITPQPANADPIAIIGWGVTTQTDKDLVSIDVRVRDRFGFEEVPPKGFFLNYEAVQWTLDGAQMLSTTGTDHPRSVRLHFGGSARAVGDGLPALDADRQREFYIHNNQLPDPPVTIFPVTAYNQLHAGSLTNVNPHHRVGRYDLYVIPGYTARGNDAEDWFHFMWHVNGYPDETGPHRALLLATDIKGVSTALEAVVGVELQAITDLTGPAAGTLRFPVRLRLFDSQAGSVRLSLSNVPPGWTAVGSWPVAGSLALGPNGESILSVDVTAPAGAVAGDSATVRVLAQHARLPTLRDAIELHARVGAPDAPPRIQAGAPLLYSGGPPPFFRVETGADPYFAVELANNPDFSLSFNSRIGNSIQPAQSLQSAAGVGLYQLPESIWRVLVALPTTRLHFRVETSPVANWASIHRSPAGTLDLVPDWPTGGPTIEPLHATLSPPAPGPPFSVPPAFRVRVFRGAFYSVEVATNETLFDSRRGINEHTFFSSWFGNSRIPGRQLQSTAGHAVYHVPDVAWDCLRQEFLNGRADRLYYRIRQAETAGNIMSAGASSTHDFIQ